MMHAQIAADTSSELRRREPRLALAAEIGLREFGSTGVAARLINLSSRGFMAEIEAVARPGSRVWLTLPGGTRANALVKWARSGRLGGEFLEPIDPLRIFQALGESEAAAD
jgi:hypothetical protein